LTIARSRAWHIGVPLNVALVAFVLFFVGLRMARPGTVFYYTEGPVLGSLAAFEVRGDISDLYPADGWVEPPVVLTLYPPVYFVTSATVDRWLGSAGTFIGLRAVSAAALLGILGLLIWHTLRRRAPVPWILALAGAALVTPGVYRVAGGAQADSLALLLTWVGITLVIGTRGDRIRPGLYPLLAGAIAFLLAFFSKQSFVAAPAVVTVSLLLERRTRAAFIFGGGLATVAVVAVVMLDAATSGGYLANTLGALTGQSNAANLRSTLAASAPLQWAPLVAAVLFASRGLIRAGFAELYLLASAALHVTAMLKTGSSANYLLEPMFALLLLAVTRWPREEAREIAPARGTGRASRIRGSLATLFAVGLGVTAVHAVLEERPNLQGWLASAGAATMSDFEGHPLADPLFFPAILQRGGRPWLNDPYAFGALEETGQWDPSRLVKDLESRSVPFALTTVDLGPRPAPPGTGTHELVMAYFWRSTPVWTALNAAYRPRAAGPITVWLPREEPEL
jgi:hypothetical protein